MELQCPFLSMSSKLSFTPKQALYMKGCSSFKTLFFLFSVSQHAAILGLLCLLLYIMCLFCFVFQSDVLWLKIRVSCLLEMHFWKILCMGLLAFIHGIWVPFCIFAILVHEIQTHKPERLTRNLIQDKMSLFELSLVIHKVIFFILILLHVKSEGK